jgi:hypothetical protein
MTLLLLGALMLLLAVAPSSTLDGRKVTHMSAWLGWGRFEHVPGPRLTATAVFVASGAVLLVLGAVL